MTVRIAFAGTSEFALPSLAACIEACDVAAVITQPDKPGSRGKPAPRPVADLASQHAIPLLQPRKIRDAEVVEQILGYRIDAFVVASFGQIISDDLLNKPRFGGVNVHPSLLPRWRGASPVAAAILAGDKVTGVCIMKMDAGLDTGPVYARSKRQIAPSDTTVSLQAELASEGATMLVDTMQRLEAGTAAAQPQTEVGVTHVRRFVKADGVVDWSRDDAAKVDRMVRGLNPWPGVTAVIRDVEVKLLSGEVSDVSLAPGVVDAPAKDQVVVGTSAGSYRVIDLQPAGKRPMNAADFLRGLK